MPGRQGFGPCRPGYEPSVPRAMPTDQSPDFRPVGMSGTRSRGIARSGEDTRGNEGPEPPPRAGRTEKVLESTTLRPHPPSMRALALLAGLGLAACATTAGFDARMRALVGVGEGDLVQALGVPEADFTTPDGRRFLQYERLGSRSPQPAPTIGFGVGGFGWHGGWGSGIGIGTSFPVYTPPPECRVTFEMRGGRVVGFSRSGTGCVATPPD